MYRQSRIFNVDVPLRHSDNRSSALNTWSAALQQIPMKSGLSSSRHRKSSSLQNRTAKVYDFDESEKEDQKLLEVTGPLKPRSKPKSSKSSIGLNREDSKYVKPKRKWMHSIVPGNETETLSKESAHIKCKRKQEKVPGNKNAKKMKNIDSTPKLPSSSPSSTCTSSAGTSYHSGAVMWAKLAGYPNWPCRILSICRHKNRSGLVEAVVLWYSWNEMQSRLPCQRLHPFLLHFESKYEKKRTKGKYQEAVACARRDSVEEVSDDAAAAAAAVQETTSAMPPADCSLEEKRRSTDSIQLFSNYCTDLPLS